MDELSTTIAVRDPQRLAALYRLAILDTPPEEGFDRLTRVLVRALRLPIALVSLVDADRQFFKSCVGLAEPWASRRETPLSHSFCQYTVGSREPLIVSDARAHPALTHSRAISELQVIAYAGVPLITSEGYVLGALCAIDTAPREWQADDLALLHDLAGAAVTELELRRDVAMREETSAALQRANAELARAAGLKGSFLATMSHELRTPLRAIIGLTQAFQECAYGPLTPRQEAVLARIEESSQHLLALVSDILDLAQVEAGKLAIEPTSLDVAELCRASLRLVEPLARAGQVSLELAVEPPALWAEADPRRLKQMLVNLLSNAVKFTPAGGRAGVDVVADAGLGLLRFTVWDTGIGISPADQAMLFQPFVQLDSRLDRVYPGTGLGLALVAHLAGLHGGAVSVESAPDAGSRFTITLPWPAGG